MYGAWHVHFESPNDTGNDLSVMLDEFESIGAKRVTVTEHDVFTSFVDLKDLCKGRELKVIPGVEGTMSDRVGDFPIHNAHMVLVAKDKVGLSSLSKIITDANVRLSSHPKEGRPIITWENLEKNVRKGHIIYSSACVQGIFGQILESGDQKRSDKRERILSRLGLIEAEKLSIVTKERDLSQKKKDKTLTSAEAEEYKVNHKLYLRIQRSDAELDALDQIEDMALEKTLSLCDLAYEKLVQIFGEENVWFELQNHFIPVEQDIYPKIAGLLDRYHTTNVLLSNDIHVGKVHPTETDFIRRNVAQYNRYHTVWEITEGDRELYIKDDPDLMTCVGKLPGVPKDLVRLGMANVEKVLSQCETDYLYEKEAHYPKFSDHANDLLRQKVEEGKKVRFPDGFPSPEYEKRLEHELSVISSMGYSDYHLIVQDYVNWTKKYGDCVDFCKANGVDLTCDLTGQTITIADQSMTFVGHVPTMEELDQMIQTFSIPSQGINIGPGRGSAVGSLVCYLLGISDVDPIQFNLLFERFLNPERRSMPDIDVDFRPDLRNKAIEYTKIKYGNTCKILTKSYGQITGNIRLAARYLGTKEYQDLPIRERAKKAEKDFLKPWYKAADVLSKGLDKSGNIDSLSTYSTRDQKIFSLAKDLSGLFLSFGQHAGGNVISPDDITDTMPLFWNEKKENFSTQCDHDETEALGFLKMDFLGLINLQILSDLIRITKDRTILDLSKREELLSDPKVYQKVFQTGRTQGVFQFESDGMKELLREFRPESFEDLVLLVALYRPGPLQYKDEIIAMKWAIAQKKEFPERSIRVKNEVLDEILRPTYGCIIYQEQVMQIFRDLAGYSLGDADLVRRFMAKKQEEKLAVERTAFLYGDPKRNIRGVQRTFSLSSEELAPYNDLFDQMMDFASYAFNKSHAAAYSLISFFTAYFKAYYPGEFYAVSLNYTKNQEEVWPYASEMRVFDLAVKKPDFSHSHADFWYDGARSIYYGYQRIKGLGKNLELTGKDYPNPKAFWMENPLTLPTLQVLTKAGAFDRLGNWKDLLSYWEAEVPNALARRKVEASSLSEEAKKKKLEKLPEMKDYLPSGQTGTVRERYDAEFQTLGLVFPTKSVRDRLNLTSAFPAGKASADVGVLICHVNTEKPIWSKGQMYYETYLCDKTGQIKKFLSHDVYDTPDGLFYLTGSPWSLSWDSVYRKELPTNQAVVFCQNEISRAGVTNLLCKVKDKSGKEKKYDVRYGRENCSASLGVFLTAQEFRKLQELTSDLPSVKTDPCHRNRIWFATDFTRR